MKKSKLVEGCIYRLINLTNGKRYIGKDKSGDPEKHRWKAHIKKALSGTSKYPLHRAINKADRASKGKTLGFSADVLWRGSVEKLNEKETYYIKKFHSYIHDPLGDKSYNLTLGGEGGHGLRHSKRTKKQLSELALLQWSTSATRETISSVLRSSEHKAVLAEAQRLRYEDPAERKKASDIARKRLKDPIERKKISASGLLSYKENPKRRQVQSDNGRLRYADPKERKRSCEAQQRRFRNPVERAKMKAAHSTQTFRDKKTVNTTQFWQAMTPEARKAYWHEIHPNGNTNKSKKPKKPKK